MLKEKVFFNCFMMKMRENREKNWWKIYLCGAGLAEPEVGVPFALEPTESLAGRDGVVIIRRCGIRVWTSSERNFRKLN